MKIHVIVCIVVGVLIAHLGAVSVADDSSRAALRKKLEPFVHPPAEFAGKLGDYRSPLRFEDGSMVKSRDDWARRRREILETWQQRLGAWPPLVGRPVVEKLESEMRDGIMQYHVHVQISPDGNQADGYLLLPKGEGPFPGVVIPFY